MKNSKSGFITPLLIVIIAVLAIGGGVYIYLNKTNHPAVQTQASISDVTVADEGLFSGNLSISWKSSNIEKVNIYLYNVGTNELGRAIATSTDNKDTYYYEIEDAAAWRDYDGPYKVIVSSSKDSSIKAESKSLKIGRPCSPDVCGDAQADSDWKTYTDVNQGFSLKYPSSWTYQKFSCNLDGVAFYPTGSSAVTCGMDSPVAPIYLYPKSGGQQTTSASLVLSTQFSGSSSYKGIYDQMVKTFTSQATQPSITVLSPNGGDLLEQNTSYFITWNYTGLSDSDSILIGFRTSNENVCWVGKTTASKRSYSFVPNQVKCSGSIVDLKNGGQFKAQLIVEKYANGLGVADTSDKYFTISSSSNLPKSCIDQQEGTPVITSLSSNSGPVGTKLVISGCNFAGFEGDLNIWIQNSQGVKGILYSEPGSTSKVMSVILKSQACLTDESYRGLPCTSYLNLTPGTYKIYTAPWGKKSNLATFTIK